MAITTNSPQLNVAAPLRRHRSTQRVRLAASFDTAAYLASLRYEKIREMQDCGTAANLRQAGYKRAHEFTNTQM
jgi:hypothetical protein